jgi:hypothetical protein
MSSSNLTTALMAAASESVCRCELRAFPKGWRKRASYTTLTSTARASEATKTASGDLDHLSLAAAMRAAPSHLYLCLLCTMLMGRCAALLPAASSRLAARSMRAAHPAGSSLRMVSTADAETATEVQDGPWPSVKMEELVALCKRRGFVFPSSEIYNGYAGFFDFGPLGVELKKNIKERWWRDWVQARDDIVGLDSSIIASPRIWEASGHVAGFSDPMVDCKESHLRYRADQIFFSPVELEDGEVIGYLCLQESEVMEKEAQEIADKVGGFFCMPALAVLGGSAISLTFARR